MIATWHPHSSPPTGATAPSHEVVTVIDHVGNRISISRTTGTTATTVITIERSPFTDNDAAAFLRAAAAEGDEIAPPWPASLPVPLRARTATRRPPPAPPHRAPPPRPAWPVSLRAFR